MGIARLLIYKDFIFSKKSEVKWMCPDAASGRGFTGKNGCV